MTADPRRTRPPSRILNVSDAAMSLSSTALRTAAFPLSAPPPPAETGLSEGEIALLRALRRLAAESLLAPRGDLDRACALLAADPAAEARRYGLALFRSFAELSARPLSLRPVGCVEPSFDERWLLALIARLRAGDRRAEHLIAFRVPVLGRRRLRFLAQGLARGADELARRA